MRFVKKQNIISFVLTFIVISLLLLSGPVSAVTVILSQPNNAYRGNNVGFSITVDINYPDSYVPLKYTNIIINGPNGFSKVCRVNMDGTDNCDDVDVSMTFDNNIGYGYGDGYGYDSRIGYGYSFGYGYGGYLIGGTSGSITYNIVWHTPSGLSAGTYTAKADTYAEGNGESHTYSSSVRSFSILNVPYNPPLGCTENWQCGFWGSCLSSGLQTRSCTDLNSCGTVNNKPSETQSCVFGTESTTDDSGGSSKKKDNKNPPPADLVFSDKPKKNIKKSEDKVILTKNSDRLPAWDELSFIQKMVILNVTSLFTIGACLFNPIKDNIPNLRFKK